MGLFQKVSVLYPEDFNWEEAGADISNMGEDALSFQMQFLKACVDQKLSL